MAGPSNSPQASYFNSGSVELRYMEVGIALSSIDRMNPGSIPFCIPAFMPKMNKQSVTNEKIIQSSKVNLVTENKAAVDVSNIEITNAIYITIPRELTAVPGGKYDFEGDVETHSGTNGSITISTSHMVGSGTVIPSGVSPGYIDVDGTTSGLLNGFSFPNAKIKGSMTITLSNSNRYIARNSKWLIAFVGGDTSMPVVVCRLPDDIIDGTFEFANA